jgi:hypothetical protein
LRPLEGGVGLGAKRFHRAVIRTLPRRICCGKILPRVALVNWCRGWDHMRKVLCVPNDSTHQSEG